MTMAPVKAKTALTVSRILHAGYLFEYEGTRVLCDPLFENPFSRNCFAIPAVEFDVAQIRRERFDAVFISHYHDDHLSFESLDLIDRATPIHLFCVHDEMFALIRDLGFRNVHSLQLGRSIGVGGITVTAHPALDRDVDSILEIEAGESRVLNVVDSWISPQVFSGLKHKTWDLVLWPFQTMRELEVLSPGAELRAAGEVPHEWLEQISELKTKAIVPSSCQFRFEEWSWLNQVYFPVSYLSFQKAVIEVAPKVTVQQMNPGTSWRIGSDSIEPAGSLPWIKPKGDQSLDYLFSFDVEPAPTADIARNFPLLSEAETNRLALFLTKELFDRFVKLELLEGSWFSISRVWLLRVCNHLGETASHYFEVKASVLTPLLKPVATVDWVTEVIARKLIGALDEGESLSSLYLRILPQNTDGSAPDILEDPLLRVLFDGQIGSYQRVQLKKLKERAFP